MLEKYVWLTIFFAASIFMVACGGKDSLGSINAPTQVGSTATTTPNDAPNVNGPQVPPTPGTGTSTQPLYLMTKPSLIQLGNNPNCYQATAADLQWVLNMSDAGASGLRFKTMVQHSDAAGCEPTIENPRDRIVVSGVAQYTPHSRGTTNFTYAAREYNCGRVQVDISIAMLDGNEILIASPVINYGTGCTPPPPPTVQQLSCTVNPSSSSTRVNQPITVTIQATGPVTSATIRRVGETGSSAITLANNTGTVVLNPSNELVGQTVQYEVKVTGGANTSPGTCTTSMTVNAWPTPSCTITPSRVRLELGQSTNVTIVSTEATNGSFNGTSIPVQSPATLSYTPTTVGNLTLTAIVRNPTNSNTCSANIEVIQPCTPTPGTMAMTRITLPNGNPGIMASITVTGPGVWSLGLRKYGESNAVYAQERDLSCGQSRTLSVTHETAPGVLWVGQLWLGEIPVVTTDPTVGN